MQKTVFLTDLGIFPDSGVDCSAKLQEIFDSLPDGTDLHFKTGTYHIYKALKLYDALSASEKAKVNYNDLLESKTKYESLIGDINDIINTLGGQ